VRHLLRGEGPGLIEGSFFWPATAMQIRLIRHHAGVNFSTLIRRRAKLFSRDYGYPPPPNAFSAKVKSRIAYVSPPPKWICFRSPTLSETVVSAFNRKVEIDRRFLYVAFEWPARRCLNLFRICKSEGVIP
jgi:hypothetical protein